MPSAAISFMQKNALQNKLKISIVSSSNRNILHRIIMHLVSSFLWTGICVAHAHRHCHSFRVHPNANRHSMLMLLMSSTFLIINKYPLQCHAVGYSYARFVGPVSGPEREILVHDAINGGSRIDYIARPEYQFSYGVEDSETQVLQNRKETRNGDEVQGVYSVVDPDGTLRVVKYTANDLNGFQAEVITNGIATNHGQSDGTIKDNGWHTEINNKDEKTHENDYEVHDQYDDEEDEKDVDDGNSKNESKNSGESSDAYYDSNDNDSDDDNDDDDDENADQIDEYEEDHSKEVSHADVYSDESDDY